MGGGPLVEDPPCCYLSVSVVSDLAIGAGVRRQVTDALSPSVIPSHWGLVVAPNHRGLAPTTAQ